MLIWQLLIFSIPVSFAGIAHMFIVKKNLLPHLLYPLDHYRTINHKRIFGDSKTYRGLLSMVILSIAGVFIVNFFDKNFEAFRRFNIIDMSKSAWWKVLLGATFGVAYIIGELPNSFIKRQRKIAEGKSGGIIHTIIDQVDSPIACLLFTKPLIGFSWQFFFAGCVFYLVLHMFFNVLLFAFGLRKNPF